MGITEDISNYDKDMDYWEGDKYVGFGIKKMRKLLEIKNKK